MSESEVAILVHQDLSNWLKLEVTAFLATAIAASAPEAVGETYRDSAGRVYWPMLAERIRIFGASRAQLVAAHRRALAMNLAAGAFIDEMFFVRHDAANREAFRNADPLDLPLVGLALRAPKEAIAKITRGLKLHP